MDRVKGSRLGRPNWYRYALILMGIAACGAPPRRSGGQLLTAATPPESQGGSASPYVGAVPASRLEVSRGAAGLPFRPVGALFYYAPCPNGGALESLYVLVYDRSDTCTLVQQGQRGALARYWLFELFDAAAGSEVPLYGKFAVVDAAKGCGAGFEGGKQAVARFFSHDALCRDTLDTAVSTAQAGGIIDLQTVISDQGGYIVLTLRDVATGPQGELLNGTLVAGGCAPQATFDKTTGCVF